MKGAREKDLPLEGVRGLCALLVILGHITYQAPLLDPGYACDLLHVDYGPQAVFVFFIISGYVIGLTSGGPATVPAIRHYCSRRLLRIVPIAWTAVLATWVLLRHNSAPTVAGNLLFLQNTQAYPFGIRVPVLYDNPPLWSLSFEMLYYALFILVWRFPVRMRTVFVVSILVAFGDFAGLPPIFTRHAAYFVFWLIGLAVARQTPPAAPHDAVPWPSAFCAAFAMWNIEPLRAVLDAISTRLSGLDADRFHVDALLGSVLIFLAATRRAPDVLRRLIVVAAALGICVLPLKYVGASLSHDDLLCCAILCLCLLARKWTPTQRPLAAMAPIGLISYALYATAYPLMRLVYRCPFLPAGSAGTFALRAVVYFALCGATALFLERVMQPRWVRWLSARFGVATSGVPRTAPLRASGG